MNADLDGYVTYLRRHGIVFDVVAGVLRCDDHDGHLVSDFSPRRSIKVAGWPEVIEHRAPDDGLAADHATEMVLRAVGHSGPWPRGRRVIVGSPAPWAACTISSARSFVAA